MSAGGSGGRGSGGSSGSRPLTLIDEEQRGGGGLPGPLPVLNTSASFPTGCCQWLSTLQSSLLGRSKDKIFMRANTAELVISHNWISWLFFFFLSRGKPIGHVLRFATPVWFINGKAISQQMCQVAMKQCAIVKELKVCTILKSTNFTSQNAMFQFSVTFLNHL